MQPFFQASLNYTTWKVINLSKRSLPKNKVEEPNSDKDLSKMKPI